MMFFFILFYWLCYYDQSRIEQLDLRTEWNESQSWDITNEWQSVLWEYFNLVHSPKYRLSLVIISNSTFGFVDCLTRVIGKGEVKGAKYFNDGDSIDWRVHFQLALVEKKFREKVLFWKDKNSQINHDMDQGIVLFFSAVSVCSVIVYRTSLCRYSIDYRLHRGVPREHRRRAWRGSVDAYSFYPVGNSETSRTEDKSVLGE